MDCQTCLLPMRPYEAYIDSGQKQLLPSHNGWVCEQCGTRVMDKLHHEAGHFRGLVEEWMKTHKISDPVITPSGEGRCPIESCKARMRPYVVTIDHSERPVMACTVCGAVTLG